MLVNQNSQAQSVLTYLPFAQVEVTCLSCPARPFVCPQSATNIPAAGSNNYSAVFSPWLSIVAQPTANSMGPRRMSRKLGTLQCGTCISNPSNLEAGEGWHKRLSEQHAENRTQRHRQRVCVAAKTSGPAFLKPRWVCSEEGPTPAHRLRATKEGRENVREKGRARGGREKETRGAGTTQELCSIAAPLLTLIPETASVPFCCF